MRFVARWWRPVTIGLCGAFLVVVLAALYLGAGRQEVESSERWFPTYSDFRARDKRILLFVHGYGGSEETFKFVPYLAAVAPDRTIMYFNYSTGALKGGLDSFSVVGSGLRAFLRNNVFSRDDPGKRAEPRVDVICHSTGCPIVRQYVLDNPRDHGIRKLITVGGANLGAYFAEFAGTFKEYVYFFAGDRQIRELRYGSPTLFNLQHRWYCTFVRHVAKQAQPAGLCRTFDPGEVSDPRRLPQVTAVAGIDHRGSFSDGVVRVESATIGCRFLAEATEAMPAGSPCPDRRAVFIPCYHLSMFDRRECRDTLLALVEATITETPVGHAHFVAQHARVAQPAEKALARLDRGAIWLRLRRNPKTVATQVDHPAEWGKIFERVTLDLPVPVVPLDDSLVIGAGWAIRARRSVWNSSEQILYWRHVKSGTDTPLTIRVDRGPAAVFRTRPDMKEPERGFNVRVHRGQTTLVDCAWETPATGDVFYCEDISGVE